MMLADDQVLCNNWLSLRKLHIKGGLLKSEIKLYTVDERKQICSLFVEIEKRGGLPPLNKIKAAKSIESVVENALEWDLRALDELVTRIKSKGFQRLTPEQQK